MDNRARRYRLEQSGRNRAPPNKSNDSSRRRLRRIPWRSHSARGHNEEGWNGGRYGVYYDLNAWRRYVSAAGFVELSHYYRPAARKAALASEFWRSEKGPGGDIAHDEAQNGERMLTKALKMSGPHKERNRTERIGWLRAAVLGANDGIVSTASLVLGVAAAHGTRSNVLVAGVRRSGRRGNGDGCR